MVLILNLLSNPPSPIGQWAKETLSRDEAVAKPFRIKTMLVNWLEKQKYKQIKDQVTQTAQTSLCSLQETLGRSEEGQNK